MHPKNLFSTCLLVLATGAIGAACGGGSSSATTTTGSASTSGGSASAGANANSGGGARATTTSTVGSIAVPTVRPDGTVVIGPGFVPTPIIMAGTAGGTVDAATMGGTTPYGTGCIGMMPATPQHVLEVTAPMTHFRIVVDTFTMGVGGSNDTTLYVRVPGGSVWCDDDGGGELQPMVEGSVMAGRVEVFVGGYSSSGVGARYKIAFTESSDYTHYAIRGTPPPAY
jgi:hypothetical protein